MNSKVLASLVGVIVISIILSNSAYGASPPSKPTDVVADDVSPTKVVLSWTSPNNGGSPITGYKIEFKKIPGSYEVLASNTQSTNTTYAHTGLETGKTYIYRIFAINAIGQSESSSEAVATPSSSSTPPENIVPNPPTELSAIDIAPTKIELKWTKPVTNNGPPITGYKIEVKKGSGSFVSIVNNTSNTATTFVHQNATTGVSHSYRIFAINSVGQSSSSNTATATTTQNSSPPQQNIPPNSPTNLVVAVISPTELALSWNAPQDNNSPTVTGYKIEVKKSGEDFSVLVANNGPKTTYRHTNLSEGTTYTYRVSAINSVGTGAPSFEATGKPQHTIVPTYLVAKPVSPTEVNLSWIAPSQTYGMPIRSYIIQEKIAPETYQTIGETIGAETNYSLSKLSTGKTYTFVVFAKYSLGASDISNEATATPDQDSTSQPKETIPSPPTGLAAFSKSISQNDLFWKAPSNDGGSQIIGYKIEVKIGTGSFTTLAHNTGNTGITFSHANLSPNTTYTYRVSAINAIGTSGPSNEASATTAVPKTITIPGPPTGLNAKFITSGQINLSWDAPTNDGGSQIIGYKIEVREDSGSFTLLSANTGKITSYSQTGIREGKTYSYRVYAINSAGTSLTSAVATLQIPSSTPTVPNEPESVEEPKVESKEPELDVDPLKRIPGFPDPLKDPQEYIQRYLNDVEYKSWYDRNFPDYTIYELLKVEPPPPESVGLCGPGTTFVNGICTVTGEDKIEEQIETESSDLTGYIAIGILIPVAVVGFLIWRKRQSRFNY